MNKIEQVARAIAPDAWSSFDSHCGLKGWDADEVATAKAKNFSIIKTLWQARIAIEAMRVPTEGMVEAGDISLPEWVSNYITNDDLSCAFDAMIDAALEGK